jgi:hypothetical protein
MPLALPLVPAGRSPLSPLRASLLAALAFAVPGCGSDTPAGAGGSTSATSTSGAGGEGGGAASSTSATTSGTTGAGGHGGAGSGQGGEGGAGGGPSYAPLELCINEFMPDNEASITDESGATPDWIELHNPGSEDIDLEGWSLTDDADDPMKSVLPAGLTLPAGGFLLLWADGGALPSPTHLGFALSAAGGTVGVFAPDGRGSLVSYGDISDDFSAARLPDCCEGDACFGFDFRGTPGQSNVEPEIVTVPILAAGGTFRFLAMTPPPIDWMMPGADDSAWPSGPAPLGYGDPHIVTNVPFGPDPLNKPITTYFRASFQVSGAASLVLATIRVLRDDGARVFLNGVEVVRTNLPAGDLTEATLAPISVGGAEEATALAFPLDPALLVEGTNVIAAEVHQSAASSSDLGFDLSIDGSQAVPPD